MLAYTIVMPIVALGGALLFIASDKNLPNSATFLGDGCVGSGCSWSLGMTFGITWFSAGVRARATPTGFELRF